LRTYSHSESMQWNPIKALDRMSKTDEIAYVPLLFGYSNYARPGFRPNLVRFSGMLGPRGNMSGGILGGVGLAISSESKHPAEAVDYARFVASGAVQRGLFIEAGGQPGHRSAWIDPAVNRASTDFFVDTLEAIDSAYLRPRFDGFLQMQEAAGRLLHESLTTGAQADQMLAALDVLWRRLPRTADRRER
jgi:multiple sugar transport system substrate-binding protein